jgi:adenosyl cobinamide kinase/adenosyl cobinamide phosphate guanylyltransferase
MLILLLGGARSGKSALAVQLAKAQGVSVTFIATATVTDHDMRARIDRHRAERPPEWRTIEEPHDLAAAIGQAAPDECVVIDCLSIWTGTAMSLCDEERVQALSADMASAAHARGGLTIAVSNEVGMGVHPVSAIGRDYRDLHGRVNAIWARTADRAFLAVAGRLIELHDTAPLLEAIR